MSESPFEIIQFLADVDDDKIYISHSAKYSGLFVMRILSTKTTHRVPDGANQIMTLGKALQALNHPNIKSVVGQTHQDAQPALIMPYYEGQSVADFLKLSQPMSPERVIRVALKLADALSAAHAIGIYHGALRPESVILAANGGVLLSEWGSNLILPPDWRASPFVAPELREGASPSSHSDIWSLGALMYHLLTLEMMGTSEDLARLCPTCPPAVIRLIDRMLDPDPYARPYRIRWVGKVLEGERPLQERVRFTRQHDLSESLPLGAAQFFGRETELNQLKGLLNSPTHRIVTVCGPAGSGRTTLVIEAANRFFGASISADSPADWRPQQVYFVRFDPDSRSDHLMLTLTLAEDIAFEVQTDELQQVINFLSERTALLILDDVENFFGVESRLAAIIQAAPGVRVLLTSAKPLGLFGEAVLTLSGLDLPSDASDNQASSIRLFETIARRRTPDFKLTSDILPEIVKLCRRVGGAPLSIVLAAGTVADLEIASLTAHVSDALSVNATSDLNLTRIRAVFEFVWSLISPHEREVVIRLSVIRGEISLDSAQSLGKTTPAQLRALVGKSLLQRVPETGGFSLHPLVHRCAQEWFSASSDSKQIWHDHSAYYLKLLYREGRRTMGAGQIEAAKTITINLDNIRRAWLWAIENQHFEAIDETAESLYSFLLFTLRLDDGGLWFAPGVSALSVRPPTPRRDAIMAALLFYHAILARQDVNAALALRCLEQAESLNRAAWSLRVNVIALNARGLYELGFGNILLARAVFEQMLTLALYEYNPRSELVASLYLGAAQYQRSAPNRIALERGKNLLKRALELCQQMGDELAVSAVYLHLGMIHASSKDPLTAIDLLNQGLRAALSINNTRTATTLLVHLSEIATQRGLHEEARAATQKLIALSRTYNHPWGVGNILMSLAQLELLVGNYTQARDLCQTLLRRIQSDPRAYPARAKARCIYAYALCCLGGFEDAIQQVQVALDDLDNDDPSEMAEVWIWMAVLTHWGRGSAQASVIFETIIQRYGSTLIPHHRIIVYSERVHTAIEMNDLDTARTNIAEVNNALYEVVTYDYRGSPLLNLLNPGMTSTLLMSYWLFINDQTEEARARLYEVIPVAIQTNSPYAMLRTLAMGATVLYKDEPLKASTWLLLIINHPQAPAAFRARVSDGFERMKKTIPPRILLNAAAHAKTLSVPDALRELRSLL